MAELKLMRCPECLKEAAVLIEIDGEYKVVCTTPGCPMSEHPEIPQETLELIKEYQAKH